MSNTEAVKIFKLDDFGGVVELEYFSQVNYVLSVNGFHTIQRLTLRNESDSCWHDVKVTLESAVLSASGCELPALAAGASSEISETLSVSVDLETLISLTEVKRTTLTLKISIDGREAMSEALNIEMCPYSHWPGMGVRPELLAAFITPNMPSVARVVSSAEKILGKISGNTSMNAYQSGNPNRVRQQVAAIYTALRREGLAYVIPPPSYGIPGQRVRMAHTVLSEKHGTCLDLTLLMASVIEAVGLRPILVLVKGHAFVGAWLVRRSYSKPVGDDPEFMLKCISDGINEMVVVETTCLASNDAVTFEHAVDKALNTLKMRRGFECFVDVVQARAAGVYPIPLSVADDGSLVVTNDGIQHKKERIEVRQLDRYDLSAFDSGSVEVTKFTIWERKLLDFSLRNTLLNMRLGSRMIPLLSFEVDKMENALQSGSNFRVMPFPLEKGPQFPDQRIIDSSYFSDLEEYAMEELHNKRLHSYLNEERLDYALKHAYRALRTSLEENGSCNLFLVMGVLRWSELSVGYANRMAPLILLPIDIVRAQGGHGYNIRTREEEATFNITLSELLRQQHSIDLTALNDLPKDDAGVDVKKVFAVVRDRIREKKGWNVLEEMLIGVFSFNKFVMWRDVHENAHKLITNDIIASLVDGSHAVADVQQPVDARQADADIQPAAYTIPIDVDSSQLEAIIDSGCGRSFILHGPPGTGKSQTITNMIANALYQGKRVLFVAEKMAALDVVRERLCRIGLDPFCLELHSNKVTKRHFLTQMEKALDVAKMKPGVGYERLSKKLYGQRKQILAYVEDLHRRGDSGLSLHDCLSAYMSIPSDAEITFDPDELAGVDSEALQEVVERVSRYDTTLFRASVHPSDHPLNAMWIKGAYAEAEAALKEQLPRTAQSMRKLKEYMESYVRVMGAEAPDSSNKTARKTMLDFASEMVGIEYMSADLFRTLKDKRMRNCLLDGLQSGHDARRLRERLLKDYSEGVLDIDPDELSRMWDEANSKWWLPKIFACRDVVKKMRRLRSDFAAEDMDRLVDTLRKLKNLKAGFERMAEDVRRLFGVLAIKDSEDFDVMISIVKRSDIIVKLFVKMHFDSRLPEIPAEEWRTFVSEASAVISELDSAYELVDECMLSLEQYLYIDRTQPMSELLPVIEHWAANMPLFNSWVIWCREADYLREHNLKNVVEYIVSHKEPSAEVAHALAKGFYHTLATKLINDSEALKYFNGIMFDDLINEYRTLTRKFQELSKRELFCRLASKVPTMTMEPHETSELGILKRNIRNGGRGTSIRHIIDQIPTLLPRLCPCMLMSPISVAQYIDLDNPKFDIVVFDEASQMPTSEAVGAIARGRSLVVVGDPKQMPPTSFFAASAVDEDEAHIDDMDSILDDCIAMSMPSRHLKWHYRSKHESLIAFSNSQYYDGRLITFPSVDDLASKVSLCRVDGVYDRSCSRSNRAEAEAVVAEVMRRLGDQELSRLSIGIVSFSKAQQDLIEDILTDTLATKPALETLAFNSPEPIFVKNLENVQGDERDVILFSVGYGPDKDGKVSMNFGPLNNSGGERRLNVAVSRARYEMMVFSSLRSDQIDLRRTSALGVVGLKHFLEYAEKGTLPVAPSSLAGMRNTADDIPLMIAKVLEERGYRVQLNVGRSGFRIDVAVVDSDDPSRFLLGILCDGPQYHSTKTVRDREIVQPAVLRLLGWKVMRVWTMDWYSRRDAVVEAIIEAINNPEALEPQEVAQEAVEIPMIKIQKPIKPTDEYKRVKLKPDIITYKFFIRALDEADERLTQQIKEIIDTEAPVTFTQVCERLKDAYDDLRSPSTQEIVRKYLEPYYSTGSSLPQGRTYWVSEEQAHNYNVYRPESDRDFQNIPVAEIAIAMRYVISEQLSITCDDLKRLTSAEFGVKRRRLAVDSTTEYVLETLIAEGFVIIEGDRVTLAKSDIE